MKMKKVVSLLLVVVFVLAFSSVAFAFSLEMNNGFESSPAFVAGARPGQFVHVGNGPVFAPVRGVMCIPTAKAGENSGQLRVANDFDNMSVLIPGN